MQAPEPESPLWKRLAWMAAIWAISVAALWIVSILLRWVVVGTD